jgi:hypothetical protein
MKQGFVLLSLAIMLFSGALDAQLIIRDQKIQAQVDRAELQTVPHVLKYSGVIEQENEIQMNGEFEFEFVIYDNQAGERIIWRNNKTVEIEDGKFEVNFGDFEPLNLSLNVPYWLDIMVNGERIGSRLCVVSTGSALKVKALTDNDNTLAAASSAGKSTGGIKNKTDQSLTEYYDERYVNDNQNEVEGDKDIVDETITSEDIKNGSLTGVDIQDESIGASKIIDGHGSSLDADKLDGHEATAFAFEGSYVKLQQETPGAQQQGNLNVSGTGLFGGKLGIGTMSPNYQLTIRNTDNHSRLSVGEDDNLSGDIGWDFTDKLLFVSTAFYNYPIRIGNNWMYFNSRGNVGIGTTSPNDKLEVSEGSIRIAGNGLMGQGNLKLIDTSQIDPAGRWGIDSYSNKLRILQATAPNYAGWEEKVVIDNSGKVGIGLNAPNESQLNIIGVSPQITIRD